MFKDFYLSWNIPFYDSMNQRQLEKRVQAYFIHEEETMEKYALQYDQEEQERQKRLIQMAQLSLSHSSSRMVIDSP